jgi:hypothetical protein
MATGGGKVGRRGFLKGATAVTLGSIAARGVYEVLDDRSFPLVELLT